MRSHCIAALQHSTCSYRWKLPVTPRVRAVPIDQAHHSTSRAGARLRREASKAEHSSISWKTYLASREFKNLASDIADAVFSPSSTSLSSAETERPSSLNARVRTWATCQPSAGALLASVLPDADDAPRNKAEKQAPSLALAA